VSKISLADLRGIFHDKTSEKFEKVVKLKEKLDSLIANNEWKLVKYFQMWIQKAIQV